MTYSPPCAIHIKIYPVYTIALYLSRIFSIMKKTREVYSVDQDCDL